MLKERKQPNTQKGIWEEEEQAKTDLNVFLVWTGGVEREREREREREPKNLID